MDWYKQKIDEVYQSLRSSSDGLSNNEVVNRIKEYGYNQLAVSRQSIWATIIEPFKSIFMLILIIAATISWFTDAKLDSVMIGAIVIINAAIYYTQNWVTNRVLRTLKKQSIQSVTVIRENKTITVPSIQLVPGDIIYIGEGERIPADARIIDVDNLQINEASLTGESIPIHKTIEPLNTTKKIYQQTNMLFQGSYIISGTGLAIVVSTGGHTEYGKIAALASIKSPESPIHTKIDHLVSKFIRVIAILAIIIFGLSLFRGMPTTEALRFMLSFSVAAVPEGLPIALTVIIVLGMRRMAKKKALVRTFKAIEGIGQVTVIATDKTGTLTKNKLSVIDSWATDKEILYATAERTIGASNKSKDPLDKAIASFLPNSQKVTVDELYPFDTQLRMSGSFIKSTSTMYLKGSPESILKISKINPTEQSKISNEIHKFGELGYRVIAFGFKKIKGSPPQKLTTHEINNIQFIGLLAFADELRPQAAGAIKTAQQAGIKVKLITGDQRDTAFTIGKQIGLAENINQVAEGKNIPHNTTTLAQYIKDKTIFARILPKEKYRILEALKKNNITAMTGDGVNDVPALSNAHVGIAMGSGSDIAQDASGIVLLNDNFNTIITAVSEGRIIFDNIRRMIFYILSTSAGEVSTMIGALLLGLPLPVTAIQILWINLVTDTAMELPLGLEPAENGHMNRPPRNPKDPLLSKILIHRIILIGLTMSIITLITVYYLRSNGHSLAYIQTVAFLTLIVAQWVNAVNARSESDSVFSRLKKPNYGLVVGFIIAFILQLLVMFGPLKKYFGIVSVPLDSLLVPCIIMSVAILVVAELHKIFIKSKNTTK